jgi:hypothetical protein
MNAQAIIEMAYRLEMTVDSDGTVTTGIERLAALIKEIASGCETYSDGLDAANAIRAKYGIDN